VPSTIKVVVAYCEDVEACGGAVLVANTPVVAPTLVVAAYTNDEGAPVVDLVITVLDTGVSIELVVPSTIYVVVAYCVEVNVVANEVLVPEIVVVTNTSVVAPTPVVVTYTNDDVTEAAELLLAGVLDIGDSAVVVVPSTITVVVAYCVEVDVAGAEVAVPPIDVVPGTAVVAPIVVVVPSTNEDVSPGAVLLITVVDTGDSTVVVVPSTIYVVVAYCVEVGVVSAEVVVPPIDVVPATVVVAPVVVVVPDTNEEVTPAAELVITVLDTGVKTVLVVPSTTVVVVAYRVETDVAADEEVVVPPIEVVPA
jgi:hypothetical protein